MTFQAALGFVVLTLVGAAMLALVVWMVAVFGWAVVVVAVGVWLASGVLVAGWLLEVARKADEAGDGL